MSRATFRQAELERILRAAKKVGAIVQVDLRTLAVSIQPASAGASDGHALTPDGHENWDDLPEAEGPRWDVPYHQIPPEPIQPPLDHREARAMEYLLTVGAEKPVGWHRLKNVGRHTQKKLLDRGYIGVSERTDRLGNPSEVWLTKAGQKAMRDLDEHRSKYPVL